MLMYRITNGKIGINMRTEKEMIDLILQIAETLKVEAVALSGSRTNDQAPKDDFQDYDIVYLVDNLENLISDLSWLDQFGNRLIEQHNILGNRRLYLMLFEDGNRIDLTLCPKDHINEWVDSEAGFRVLVDEKGLFETYLPNSKRYWIAPPPKRNLQHPAMNFGGYRLMSSRAFEEINWSMRLTTSTLSAAVIKNANQLRR